MRKASAIGQVRRGLYRGTRVLGDAQALGFPQGGEHDES
jgi:hypothetical protein